MATVKYKVAADRTRLSGPDDSHPYAVYGNTNQVDGTSNVQSSDEVRPMFVRCGTISQAQGSAYIELSNTKVICAVYGPREFGKREDFTISGRLTCDFKFATFASRRRRQHQQDPEEKELSDLVLQSLSPSVCLHKFPKAQVDICIMVLEDSGSALAAAITCGSVALADAGIEMYDLVVACSARQYGNQLIVHPTDADEQAVHENAVNDGVVTVAFMPSLNQISGLLQTGEMHSNTAAQAIRACIGGCNKIYLVIQQTLAKSVKKKFQSDSLDENMQTS